MSVSILLRELAAHGVDFTVDGSSLRATKWPNQCSKELRESYAKNKQKIMSRLAIPVFLHMQTNQRSNGSMESDKRAFRKLFEDLICVILIDDELIVWLPGLSQQFAREIYREFARPQAGTRVDKVQIVSGLKLPSIVRLALRAGRALCAWNSPAVEEAIWCRLNIPVPIRWIDLRNLARAGGWAVGFDDLVWNVLHVHPNRHNPSGNSSLPNRRNNVTEITAHWVARIRNEVDHVLCVADLYDRLHRFDEPELLELHDEINCRGIGLNVDAARIALCECRKYAERKFSHITEATGGTMTPASLVENQFVISWLQLRGLRLPNLSADTIEWLRNHMAGIGVHCHPSVEAVLKARVSLDRQPFGTLMRALTAVDESGRVRNHMNYFNNRSGEFSFRQVAVRDLLFASYWKYMWKWGIATAAPPDEEWLDLTIDEARQYDLGDLVSNCFIPRENHEFIIVELRGLATEILWWLVGDRLQVVYDSEEIGMDLPPPWIDEARCELAQQISDALTRGQRDRATKWQLSLGPDLIEVCLPSGRSIYYRNVASFSEDRLLNDDGPNALATIDQPVRREWPNVNSMVTDLVHAINRDVMTSALFRCSASGSEIVAHGSDFILLEVAKDARIAIEDAVFARLQRPPKWAGGLHYEVDCWCRNTLGRGWVTAVKVVDLNNPLALL